MVFLWFSYGFPMVFQWFSSFRGTQFWPKLVDLGHMPCTAVGHRQHRASMVKFMRFQQQAIQGAARPGAKEIMAIFGEYNKYNINILYSEYKYTKSTILNTLKKNSTLGIRW